VDRKRPIDRQREAAITMKVGDDEDASSIKDFLSTENALYTIKDKGVYKTQLADDIDPGRTNPDIPNLSQKVLPAGNDNEIVARILLTAKCLFDENNATVSPFVGFLFEESINLTRHALELEDMISNLKEKIIQKELEFEDKEHIPNAFLLPSITDLDRDLHNICVKADKAKDSILSLYRLYFFPDVKKRPTLSEYDAAIKGKLSSRPDIIRGWEDTNKFMILVRNIRNASEHRRDGNQLVVKDFEMQPDSIVNPPLLEVEHEDTPIEPVRVVDFLDFIGNAMLDQAEGSIVTLRCAALLERNPFNEEVGFLSAENRRHPLVRYCRAINLNGEMRILG